MLQSGAGESNFPRGNPEGYMGLLILVPFYHMTPNYRHLLSYQEYVSRYASGSFHPVFRGDYPGLYKVKNTLNNKNTLDSYFSRQQDS